MKHFPVVQGSEAWRRLRMGMPTASEFDRIITPKKWEPTKGETRRNFMLALLTELILDTPRSGVTTAAMDHGHDWEPRARAAYEMLTGYDVELCGFCTDDAGTYGASPDGLIPPARKSLEIKSPERPENHLGYMLNPESLVQEYWVQTQGQLYVLGEDYDSTDLISYFSGMPMVCVNVPKHAEFQGLLAAALKTFTGDLALLADLAKERGWIPERQPEPDHSKDFLTDDDVTAILGAIRNGDAPGAREAVDKMAFQID